MVQIGKLWHWRSQSGTQPEIQALTEHKPRVPVRPPETPVHSLRAICLRVRLGQPPSPSNHYYMM